MECFVQVMVRRVSFIRGNFVADYRKNGMIDMQKNNSKLFVLIFLGVLSAFGPFIMDMYLPTLPAMTESFHTSPTMVQLGLTACLTGLAVGQLVFGIISDRYGRRCPLLVAMMLFLLSTAGCLLVGDISHFVALRFVQGFAGAGGVVLSRSVATDLYQGHELTSMLAMIGAVNGIATVLAPVGGGLLSVNAGWKGIFCFLLALGVLLLAGCLRFRESLPTERRLREGWRQVPRHFGIVLHNRRFVLYILQYGLALGVLFVNISSAPFIMQEHYGLTAMQFSLCFGINAVAMVLASVFSAKFSTAEQALRFSNKGMLAFAYLLFACLAFGSSFLVYEVLAFGMLAMVGLSFTASNTLAMDCERRYAGVASALLGAMGYVFAGIVPMLVGLGDNMLLTAGILFVGCSCCAYACMQWGASGLHPVRQLLKHFD